MSFANEIGVCSISKSVCDLSFLRGLVFHGETSFYVYFVFCLSIGCDGLFISDNPILFSLSARC